MYFFYFVKGNIFDPPDQLIGKLVDWLISKKEKVKTLFFFCVLCSSISISGGLYSGFQVLTY